MGEEAVCLREVVEVAGDEGGKINFPWRGLLLLLCLVMSRRCAYELEMECS